MPPLDISSLSFPDLKKRFSLNVLKYRQKVSKSANKMSIFYKYRHENNAEGFKCAWRKSTGEGERAGKFKFVKWYKTKCYQFFQVKKKKPHLHFLKSIFKSKYFLNSFIFRLEMLSSFSSLVTEKKRAYFKARLENKSAISEIQSAIKFYLARYHILL